VTWPCARRSAPRHRVRTGVRATISVGFFAVHGTAGPAVRVGLFFDEEPQPAATAGTTRERTEPLPPSSGPAANPCGTLASDEQTALIAARAERAAGGGGEPVARRARELGSEAAL